MKGTTLNSWISRSMAHTEVKESKKKSKMMKITTWTTALIFPTTMKSPNVESVKRIFKPNTRSRKLWLASWSAKHRLSSTATNAILKCRPKSSLAWTLVSLATVCSESADKKLFSSSLKTWANFLFARLKHLGWRTWWSQTQIQTTLSLILSRNWMQK